MDALAVVQQGYYCAAELACLPGVPGTTRGIGKMAERQQWSSRPRAVGKGNEYAFASLPEPTRAALLLRAQPAPAQRKSRGAYSEARIAALWGRYARAKQPLKDVAAQRLKALQTLGALMRSGMSTMEARGTVAAQLQADQVRGASAPNLARWQKAVEGAHASDWLALLLPSYTGRTATVEMPAEAWELFKADWLRLEQPSASSCYDRLCRIAATRGWTLPSLRTFERRIEREIDPAVITLARRGEEALDRMYPAQERDRSMFAALDGVNADGHRWDIAVRFPDGAIGRPSILGWQDLYSGKMLSWRLCDHESSDAVRLSFGDMVRSYGVPRGVWLDNGRAFASKWMTGGTPNRYRFKIREEDPVGLLTALVGADNVHWVTPYHGQAKPIERAWRDFCDRIAKHPAFAGAYVGNNPTAKPENYGSRAVDWDEFTRVVDAEIAAHNARDGRRTKVCQGRSFDAVFAASYAATVVRKVSAEQLHRLLLAAEAVTADGRDGSVRLAGNRYWTEALSRHAGRKVVLRVDPVALHGEAHVYALDGSYICTAPCVAAVGFADTQAAREHARGKAQFRRARKDMLAAERLMDAASVAAQMPTPPPESLPDAAAIAPVFRDHGKPLPQPSAMPDADAETRTASLDSMLSRMSAHLGDSL